MLSSLHIENIAVIKSADIDFNGGFTVLTGETGAGKSIIIDSLGLICGAKQSRELIRNGEDSAKVSAVFTELGEQSQKALSELGISADEDGVLMFERTITTQGKSTSRINGRVIPLSLQREAMKSLIAIHGQHDNMALLIPENHMTYLDEFADIGAELEQYTESYDKYCELNRRISDITKNEREKAQKLEFLRYQIGEIEAVKLKEGEEEKLLARRSKLENSEKIAQLSDMVYSLLYRNEKSTAALDKVNRASRALETLSPVLDDADSLISRLDAVSGELEDIALTVDALRDDEIVDPTAELDKVETRLEEISKLERKYGDTVEDVLKFLASAKEELETIELSEERLAELTHEREKLISVMDKQAAVLSERRKASAKMLEKMIVDELSYLDMGGVSFSCGVVTRHRVEGDGGVHYAKRGVDDVEFLISTNKGEPLKPLAKIASGGELSRIMLAIKSVLVKAESPGTLIFDEVDTGVSGKTSQKIGIKLRELAKAAGTQVFCVTHAAQIASRAENHYLIAKSESGGRVSTSVTPLDRDGRINEVARIMGGINITDTLIETAREMIDEVI
ncbi:MAG: DNA repair protein RecN [Clostridia bacterium]|nr:DNA repair protein RecN [Clostridia bacterium]